MNNDIEVKTNNNMKILLRVFYAIVGVLAIVFGFLMYKDFNDFYVDKESYKLSSDSTHTLVIYRKKGKKNSNRNYTFKVENTNIATIDDDGKIVPVSDGETNMIITSKRGHNVRKVPLTIVNSEAQKIELNKTEIVIHEGDKVQISATVNGEPDVIYSYMFLTNNSDTASVDEYGNITGLNFGRSVITATTPNGLTAECYITVLHSKDKRSNVTSSNSNRTSNTTSNSNSNVSTDEEVPKEILATGIKVDSSALDIKVGSSSKITAVVLPVTATNRGIKWTSSNDKIVKVDSNGNISAKSAGTAVITATTTNGHSAKVTVRVANNNVAVTSIALSKNTATINIGDTIGITAIVAPSNATDKSVIWTSSNPKVATVSNGIVRGVGSGKTTITAKASNGKTVTCTINVLSLTNVSTGGGGVNSSSKMAEVYFLNTTKTRSSLANTNINSNEAIIIKTVTGRYILLDTGDNNATIKNIIYNRLSKLQNKEKVTIDYMIISHSDGDHSGNAANILKDSKMIVKNLIIKKEAKQVSVYNNIISARNTYSEDTNLLTTSEHGDAVVTKAIDNYTNMYIYNTQDVFLNNDCVSITDYKIKFNSASAKTKTISNAVKLNGKYVYIKGYNNPKLYTTDKIIPTTNFAAKDRVFYAQYEATKQKCSANSNSLALLFETNTTAGKKYMYFPSDLENNGYSLFGTGKIYGNGTTYFYSFTAGPNFTIKNNLMVQSSRKIVKKPQEASVAKTIAGKIGSGKISIYQESHHGLNNDPYAINTLGLNNKNVYSIATYFADGKEAYNYLQSRSALSTLNKANRMYTGYKGGNGVYCSILYSGNVSCKYY